MGIIDKIKEKLKKGYEKVDKTIFRGYLPGGAETAKQKETLQTQQPLQQQLSAGQTWDKSIENAQQQGKTQVLPQQTMTQKLGGVVQTAIQGKYTNLEKMTGEKVISTAIPIGPPTGIITRTATPINSKVSMVTQRAFGGGGGGSEMVNKLFGAFPKTAAVAARYGVNAKSSSLTTNLLIGAGLTMGAASILQNIIGTYPFAGFIEEEAIQTMGMGFWEAYKAGNLEEAEKAIAINEEIINFVPGIMDKLPYINVIKSLNRFRKTAELKTMIDKELIRQERIKQETGKTNAQIWEDIRKENELREEQKRIDDEEYYRKIMEAAEIAREERRREDEEYWNKILAEKDERIRKEREATNQYWEEVKKEQAKLKEEMSPSNLNFGLLK